jgi:hypothetical protein
MILDWKDSIDNILFSEHLRPKRYYHWNMPRQSGVTTYLTNLAKYLHYHGHKVLFITRRLNDYNYIKRNFNMPCEIDNISEGSFIKGKTLLYNYIISDNVSDKFMLEIIPAIPTTSDTKIVHINTTEG